MIRSFLASLALATCCSVVHAAPVVIKMATMVPDGSIWDKELREIAAQWQKQSDGEVVLRIYPGGVAGDEEQVVRKMRIGSLHAGAITVAGLTAITPAFEVLAIPLFIRTYDELDFLLDEMEEELARSLDEKGFVFLSWGIGGWAHFFSTEPVRTVDDLRSLKMFKWAGDQRMVRWWQSNGFKPVPLAMTDIMPGLRTGQIEVMAVPPLAALSLQWFRSTPYMHDLGLGPVVGANVVSKRVWNKIPTDLRPTLLEIAKKSSLNLSAAIPGQEASAVEEMKRRGLTVTTSSDQSEWTALAEKFTKSVRGTIVPTDVLDRAEEVLSEYRSRDAEGANR